MPIESVPHPWIPVLDWNSKLNTDWIRKSLFNSRSTLLCNPVMGILPIPSTSSFQYAGQTQRWNPCYNLQGFPMELTHQVIPFFSKSLVPVSILFWVLTVDIYYIWHSQLAFAVDFRGLVSSGRGSSMGYIWVEVFFQLFHKGVLKSASFDTTIYWVLQSVFSGHFDIFYLYVRQISRAPKCWRKDVGHFLYS